MKSWKKLWKDQLDEITPALRNDIKNADIPFTHNIDNNGANAAVASMNRQKKWIPIVAAVTALTLCLMIILCVCLIMPTKSNEDFLFTLEINPSIALSTDKNGIVNGVIAANSDADIILADEDILKNIKGKSLDKAITYFTDYAAQLGYIDLDSTGSAIRISGMGSDDILTKAKSSLEDYFMSKGVLAVVIAESVNKEEFALRSGIDSNLSFKDTAKFIKDSTILFCDRAAEGENLQSIQSLYNQFVIDDKLFDYVNDSLTENVEKIIKNAKDIENLSQLYFEIFRHDDNPLKPIGDYWAVKKLYDDSIEGEFAQLMTQMDSALQNYKLDYGVDINSLTQLKEALSSYIKIPTNMLSAFLEKFSLEIFKELAADIVEIMEVAGLVKDGFAKFVQLPQSFEDYVEKTLEVIKYEFNARLDSYENIYNKIRQPIQKDDYTSYIDGLVEKYGSLNEYWQQIKN